MKRSLLLSAAIAVLSFGSLQASFITFTVGDFDEDGFSGSFIHTATGGAVDVDGVTWYTDGTILGTVHGELTGELSGDGLTFYAGTLDILDIDGPLGAYSLEILGGELSVGDPAGGFLDYSITDGIETFSEGTFYFAEHSFNAFANAFNTEGFDLWGQNFLELPTGEGKHEFIRLGLDLHGEGVSVPEPATMAMMGLGIGAAAFTQRRRKRRGPADVPTDDEITEAIDER